MALKIRLRQHGKRNQQTYRIVVADIRTRRDGKYLEKLGWYNPMQDGVNYSVNSERVDFWLKQGAEISERAELLLKKGAPEVFKERAIHLVKRREKMARKRAALKKEKALAREI